MFRKLLKADDITDRYIILDYFSFKVIDLINKEGYAEDYQDIFLEFEEHCLKSNSQKDRDLNVFFFVLRNILMQKQEMNDREYMKLYVKNLMEITREDMIKDDRH